MKNNSEKKFAEALLEWFDCYGRNDLPWQHPRSAYRVWISEIMLQQTQVKTVIPYFNRFMTSFPDLLQLACASEDQVLAHWSGLGYYSRARNLIKTAKIICEHYQGNFPQDLNQLVELPGIGPSTAAAITSQAFNQPTAILDGNVKRVLSRYFVVDGWPEQALVKKRLWSLAQSCMTTKRCADYTQAIMDLGATCCTTRKPNCANCPLQKGCQAYTQEKVSDYPQKKIKKTLPTREEQFLLLYDSSNQIYLEKRPATGIWGGLWCLPSIEAESCPNTYIKKNYGFTSLRHNELLAMKHTFSHFHLYIKAMALQIELSNESLAENSGRWFASEELNGLGLAKPVSKIISYFLNTAAY